MSQKRVVAIHDISCFGKCSLTVALPILSACGHECAVIPTAVLSTHTGGFTGYTFRDLTEDILPIAEHWKKEGIMADAFYTGYLGSPEQASLVAKAVSLIRTKDSLIVTDPAMADDGKLYPGFEQDFPGAMLELCQQADIIVPNITEACLMTGLPYSEPPYDKPMIEMLLHRLYELTKADVVLTGVAFDHDHLGAAVLKNGHISYILKDRLPGLYHGTGDVFGSGLVGALLAGYTLPQSTSLAADLVCDSISATLSENPDRRYGVNFESVLKAFLEKL